MENKDNQQRDGYPFTQIRDELYKSWFKNLKDEKLVKNNVSLYSEWATYNVAEDGLRCCTFAPNVNIYSHAKRVNIFAVYGSSRVFTYGERSHVNVGGNHSIVCVSGNETSVNIDGDHNFSLIGGEFSDVSIHGKFNIASIVGTGVSVSDFGQSNSLALYGTDILCSVLGDGSEVIAEGDGARISVLGPHSIIDVRDERSVVSILSDNCAFRTSCADTVFFVAEYGCVPEESQESVVHTDIFSAEKLNIKTDTWYMYESGELHEMENPPSYRIYNYAPDKKEYNKTTLTETE